MIDVLGALREGLAPHYTVEREIGAGGMARVFLAVERHPPRKVAGEKMKPPLSRSPVPRRVIPGGGLTPPPRHPPLLPLFAPRPERESTQPQNPHPLIF